MKVTTHGFAQVAVALGRCQRLMSRAGLEVTLGTVSAARSDQTDMPQM